MRQLPELTKLNQRKVFSDGMSHPVVESNLSHPCLSRGRWRRRGRLWLLVLLGQGVEDVVLEEVHVLLGQRTGLTLKKRFNVNALTQPQSDYGSEIVASLNLILTL